MFFALRPPKNPERKPTDLYNPRKFQAPRRIKGEEHDRYLDRLAQSFEDWVNG